MTLIFYSSARMQPRVPLDRVPCRHYCLLVARLSSSAECVRRRRVTEAVTSSLCVRSACCLEGSCCSSTGPSTLLSWLLKKPLWLKGIYYICCLEPLLACILTCMHAALVRASKIKSHDYVRSTFLQYCGTR